MPLSIDLASPRLAVHRHHVCACVYVQRKLVISFMDRNPELPWKKKGRIRIPAIEREKNHFSPSLYKDRKWNGIFFFFNKKLIKIIETRLKINHSDPWRRKLIIVPFELENLKMKRLDIVRGDCHRETKGIVSVFFLRNTWRRGGRELCQPVLQPPQHIVREACRGEKKGLLNFSFS